MTSSAFRPARSLIRELSSLRKTNGTSKGRGSFAHYNSIHTVRKIAFRATPDMLAEPNVGRSFVPWLTAEAYKQASSMGVLKGGERLRRAMREDEWLQTCSSLFRNTGLPWNVRPPGIDPDDQTMLDPNHRGWGDVMVMRNGCQKGLVGGYSPEIEIIARKLCAETQDHRYATIYRSLPTQANTLYLLGRTELEREPQWRKLGWYMLTISAGLGHLDAALLLHRLHQIDPAYSLGAQQRAIVAKAAETRLDWRAIVAHSEAMISQLRTRRKGRKIDEAELEPYLAMLSEASQMTKPDQNPSPIDLEMSDGYLEAAHLERFEPPYKAILALTTEAVLDNTASERTHEYFQSAVYTGAKDYNDPDAAWLYAQWLMKREEPYSPTWLWSTRLAAEAGNDDACFELGRYLINRDGWLPSLTERVLSSIRRRELEKMGQYHSYVDEEITSDGKKHEEIMKHRDPRLLEKFEGIAWLLRSAELSLDDPVKIINRSSVASGLLRQNGFLPEGFNAMIQAQKNLKFCTRKGELTNRAQRKVMDFLKSWDQRFVHQLLPVEHFGPLLGPPLKISPRNKGAN